MCTSKFNSTLTIIKINIDLRLKDQFAQKVTMENSLYIFLYINKAISFTFVISGLLLIVEGCMVTYIYQYLCHLVSCEQLFHYKTRQFITT